MTNSWETGFFLPRRRYDDVDEQTLHPPSAKKQHRNTFLSEKAQDHDGELGGSLFYSFS